MEVDIKTRGMFLAVARSAMKWVPIELTFNILEGCTTTFRVPKVAAGEKQYQSCLSQLKYTLIKNIFLDDSDCVNFIIAKIDL